MSPRRLTDTDLHVLRTVRSMVGRNRVRTSHKQLTIARAAGCCERTIRTAFVRLESWGYLTRTARPLPNGGRRPDLIDLARHRRPKRQAVAGSDVLYRSGTPTEYADTDFAQTRRGGVMTQQPSFFGTKPRARKPRTPSQNDHDYALWLRVFREETGRERIAAGQTAMIEERGHLKKLRARFPEGRMFESMLREFAGLDDKWLDDRDYPLRYLFSHLTYVRVVKAAEEVAAARPSPVPEDPDTQREYWRKHDERMQERNRQREAERQQKRQEQQALLDRLTAERQAQKRAKLEGR